MNAISNQSPKLRPRGLHVHSPADSPLLVVKLSFDLVEVGPANSCTASWIAVRCSMARSTLDLTPASLPVFSRTVATGPKPTLACAPRKSLDTKQRRCQQGVNGGHGYSTQCRAPDLAKGGPLAAKTRNSPHSTDTRRCDHNPRVGVRVPPPASIFYLEVAIFGKCENTRLANCVPNMSRTFCG